MSKIKNDGLDQYGAGPFEQQQFGTAGVEVVDFVTARRFIYHVRASHAGETSFFYRVTVRPSVCQSVCLRID